MRRIQVVDTNDDPDTQMKQLEETAALDRTAIANKPAEENKTAAVNKIQLLGEREDPAAAPPQPEVSKPATRIKIEEVDSSLDDSLKSSLQLSDKERVSEEKSEELPTASGGSKSRGLGRKMEDELMAAAAQLGTERGIPSLPTTFAQFTKDWRTLHSPEQRYYNLTSVLSKIFRFYCYSGHT